MKKKVIILGEEWIVETRNEYEDATLIKMDGYTDKTARLIVVAEKSPGADIADFEKYQRKVIRHEVIHAFLFESGLHENFMHQDGHDETYVDWFAVQYPKIAAVFAELGVEK